MHILMLGNFGVFSFLRSWKLTRFLSTCISETSFKIWTFSAFLYIAETTRTNFFEISSHNLHNVYNKVWNFHRDWFTDIWYLRPAYLMTVGQILAWKVGQGWGAFQWTIWGRYTQYELQFSLRSLHYLLRDVKTLFC